MPTIWLDSPPTCVIDGHGARIDLNLGESTASYRLPRSAWREFIERSQRALDAADREQQAGILHLRRSCPLPEHLRCG